MEECFATLLCCGDAIDSKTSPRKVPLSPGMAVTVEIKTGTRRLLEYFFSPILQAGQESVRER